jgi:hypothetical protein
MVIRLMIDKTLTKDRLLRPVYADKDGQSAVRLCDVGYDNLENKSVVVGVGEEPSSFALGDYVAQVIVDYVDDLVVGYLECLLGVFNLVLNFSSVMATFRLYPWSLY